MSYTVSALLWPIQGLQDHSEAFFFFGCSLKWESSMFSRLFTSSYLIPCPTIFGPEASGSISGTQGELPWFHLLQSSQSPLYTRKASSSFMSKTSLISFLLYILRLRKKKQNKKPLTPLFCFCNVKRFWNLENIFLPEKLGSQDYHLTTTRVIIFVCKDKVQGLQNDVLLIFQGQTWMHLYITLFSNNSQD